MKSKAEPQHHWNAKAELHKAMGEILQGQKITEKTKLQENDWLKDTFRSLGLDYHVCTVCV